MEAVNNIDNNLYYGIETIDILKEVIIYNIKMRVFSPCL